jgi:hypothetical protein
MRSIFIATTVASLLGAPALAVADELSSADAPPTLGWMGAESRPDGGPRTMMQVIPEQVSTYADAVAGKQIIFMNRAGGTYAPGNNDARTNRSSLAKRTVTIAPWSVNDAGWAQVMSCVRQIYAPFNVTITDVDPGNTPHVESVVAGRPSDLSLDDGVGGVSPFTLDCGVIPNAVVYTFAEIYGNDLETVCEVVAQETAHSFGLDHEILASDPMTYLDFEGLKQFRDADVKCGEFQQRACGLPGGAVCRESQNSYKLLAERIGLAAGTAAVAITSPRDGTVVPPSFVLEATANAASMSRIELWVDGALKATKTAAPYSFATELGVGAHSLELRGYAGAAVTTSKINVTVQLGAPSPGAGGGSGPTADTTTDDTVVGGCDAASGAPGILVALAIYGLARRRKR